MKLPPIPNMNTNDANLRQLINYINIMIVRLNNYTGVSPALPSWQPPVLITATGATTYTLPYAPLTNSEHLTVGGAPQYPPQDYSIDADSLVFTTAPPSGTLICLKGQK